MMQTRTKLIIVTVLAGFVLSGCASGQSRQNEMPVGIGPSPNQLKQSPCACIELPNAARAS
jgi:hypothetical protein